MNMGKRKFLCGFNRLHFSQSVFHLSLFYWFIMSTCTTKTHMCTGLQKNLSCFAHAEPDVTIAQKCWSSVPIRFWSSLRVWAELSVRQTMDIYVHSLVCSQHSWVALLLACCLLLCFVLLSSSSHLSQIRRLSSSRKPGESVSPLCWGRVTQDWCSNLLKITLGKCTKAKKCTQDLTSCPCTAVLSPLHTRLHVAQSCFRSQPGSRH